MTSEKETLNLENKLAREIHERWVTSLRELAEEQDKYWNVIWNHLVETGKLVPSKQQTETKTETK